MSCCAGRSVLVLLAACAADPDAHFEVTRAAGAVTVQLCEPGSAVGCKTSALFEGDESEATVRTLDLFIDDQSPELDLIFSQDAGARFCHRVVVTFATSIDAAIALGSDAATAPRIERCETCRLEACAP